MKHLISILASVLLSINLFSQETPIIEPPSWWAGMKGDRLQLLVYGKGIAYTAPRFIHSGVQLTGVGKTGNPDYLFLDLKFNGNEKAGTFTIDFERDENIRYTYTYELKERNQGSSDRGGFGPEDVIYLAMPDRFSNGDPANDNVSGMLEEADRNNPDGRHGGDLQGVVDHLDYVKDMGFTAIWLNPVLENNNPEYSYHGYAITNFYKIDPRYGSNEGYRDFVNKAHENGIKVIKDMVFNHCGHRHWWMENLPVEDWVHQWPEFTRSNFRAPVISDPHASEYDKTKMQEGWFDTNMPDLNQKNQYLANYLIQNAIWWVEFAGLDGIRMDTYPYSDQAFMRRWMKRMHDEYPNFIILGETWLQKEAITSYYAASEKERYGYNSYVRSVTDFPVHYAVEKAFHENETWTEGMARLYYVLAQDFLYDNPYNNVIFPDNHDLTRYYTLMGTDIRKYKMGLAFLMTTRGVPMIYYGTEILMEGEEPQGHGFIRQDFPGGWKGDEVNVFEDKGLSDDQKEAKSFLQRLLLWRKGSEAVHKGRLVQFIPEDGVYVYFRIFEDKKVMVVLNNNEEETAMPDPQRFEECLNGDRDGLNVIEGWNIVDLNKVMLEPKSANIIEL